jgi:hypothetical protein
MYVKKFTREHDHARSTKDERRALSECLTLIQRVSAMTSHRGDVGVQM